MKPAAFDYLRAETLDEALAALARHGEDARIVAGGQSLMPMLNMRLAKPAVLIDVMRIAELDRIDVADDAVTVGAGVRQAKLLAWDRLEETLPLVARGLPWTGHVQTRSRGTVCGSIAHSDPSAELPLLLAALGGSVHLRSKKGRRRVAATDFTTGMMSTARADDELIEAVSFPRRPGAGVAFHEVARRHGDFAIVACAAVVTKTELRFAVGGVADRPEVRVWPPLSGADLDGTLDRLAWQLGARDDHHATARFRRDLVRSIGRLTVEEAMACRR